MNLLTILTIFLWLQIFFSHFDLLIKDRLSDSLKEKKREENPRIFTIFPLNLPHNPTPWPPIFQPNLNFLSSKAVFSSHFLRFFSLSLSFPDHHHHHNHNDRHFYHFSFYYFSIKLTLWGSSSFSLLTGRQKKSDAKKFPLNFASQVCSNLPPTLLLLKMRRKICPPVLKDPSFFASFIKMEQEKKKLGSRKGRSF